MNIHNLSLILEELLGRLMLLTDIIDFQKLRSDFINSSCLVGLSFTILYALTGQEDSVTLILLASILVFTVGIIHSYRYVTLTYNAKNVSEAREGSYSYASGVISGVNDTLSAPFTDDEGMMVAWKIEEERNILGRKNTDTISRGIIFNKFQIEDDNGTVTVDFKDCLSKYNTYSIFNKFKNYPNDEKADTVTVESGEKPPQRIESFINSKTDVSQAVPDNRTLGHSRRRYKQYVFKEGDEIYVKGIYKKDGFEDVIRDADEGTYVIGDSKDNYIDEIATIVNWSIALSLPSAIIGILSVISFDTGLTVSWILTVIGTFICLRWLLG
jgi:hypothetical protein